MSYMLNDGSIGDLFGRVYFHFLEIPDIFGVLLDGSVAAELPSPQSIHNRHLGPFLFILVSLVDFFLSLKVGFKVSADQVPVVVVCYSAD